MDDSIETREVLAGAYGRFGLPRRMHSHAVVVDFYGAEQRVLCKHVQLENLADRHASDPYATPTCPYCLIEQRRREGKLKPKRTRRVT